MSTNQNVKSLKGLKATAGNALAKDVNAEIQDVTIVKTIDYLNMTKSERLALGKKEDSTWQGYMIRFDETSAGVPKIVPISAGRLKAIEDEEKIEVFTETKDGFELINFRMGIKDGEVVFEK